MFTLCVIMQRSKSWWFGVSSKNPRKNLFPRSWEWAFFLVTPETLRNLSWDPQLVKNFFPKRPFICFKYWTINPFKHFWGYFPQNFSLANHFLPHFIIFLRYFKILPKFWEKFWLKYFCPPSKRKDVTPLVKFNMFLKFWLVYFQFYLFCFIVSLF